MRGFVRSCPQFDRPGSGHGRRHRMPCRPQACPACFSGRSNHGRRDTAMSTVEGQNMIIPDAATRSDATDLPHPSTTAIPEPDLAISSLFDSHCHLAFSAFDMDREEVVARARAARVVGCIVVAVDPKSARAAKLIATGLPGWGYPTAGIHPTEFAITDESAWRDIETLLDEGGFVAVGETGLDAFHKGTSLDDQALSLQRHLGAAVERKLPVILHCRNAFERLTRELDAWRGTPLRGVLHCFTGAQSDVSPIIDAGLHIGVGGAATFRPNNVLRNAVKDIPIHRLLLETDSPWLAPVPVRGRRNEPAFIGHVARRLADDRGLNYEILAATTTANAHTLFGLDN